MPIFSFFLLIRCYLLSVIVCHGVGVYLSLSLKNNAANIIINIAMRYMVINTGTIFCIIWSWLYPRILPINKIINTNASKRYITGGAYFLIISIMGLGFWWG